MSEGCASAEVQPQDESETKLDVMKSIVKLEVTVVGSAQEVVSVACVACGEASAPDEACDADAALTSGGASLYACLCRRAPPPAAAAPSGPGAPEPRYLCLKCAELLEQLERTELEYLQLKRSFEEIISRNPLYTKSGISIKPIDLKCIKTEKLYDDCLAPHDMDSEDEPLVITKKKKPLKKKNTISKEVRSKRKKDKWECKECGVTGGSGGAKALASHISMSHMLPVEIELKTEDDQSLDSQFSNSFSIEDEKEIKVELDNVEVEVLNDLSILVGGTRRRRGRPRKEEGARAVSGARAGAGAGAGGKAASRRDKTMHKCDHCEAKFTSLARLERHARAHESGPPYICEVCGAHYKHRRACDIHIALHKGISDWKCEECNRLFPSKSALHRHNNIHTGKPNYQCDQCGKSFIHTSSFKMHKLAHSGVKPHQCALCGLALMTTSHLKRHLRVHSGEKRYECKLCGKKFSERYNLAAHAKSHEATGAEVAPVAPSLLRKKHFRCAFCFERYERRYMLERHCQTVHGRALERPAPRPRNTMSKLLKQRALSATQGVEIKQSESPPAGEDSSAAAAPAGAPLPPATSWSEEFTRLHQYSH